MSLRLPQPILQWSPTYQLRVNQTLEANDVTVQHKQADYEIAPKSRLIMHSPNGARWSITVSNTGTIAATALP